MTAHIIKKRPTKDLIDWLSFTVKHQTDLFHTYLVGKQIEHVMTIVANDPVLAKMHQNVTRPGQNGLELHKGRFPYKHMLKDKSSAFRLYFDDKHDHVLFELSGQGCAMLSELELLTLIGTHREQITRLDLATDIECDTSPTEILDTLDAGRFRSTGHYVSDSGSTVYVGSQKSDRYARVYRYFYPHPRHKWLRYEMVFRRQQAQTVAQTLLDTSLRNTIAEAGEVFGWSHESWQYRSTRKIECYRPMRGQAKSERWFYSQVAPAIKRLMAEGVLTRTEVLTALGMAQSGEASSPQ